jgi:hypothetical protein
VTASTLPKADDDAEPVTVYRAGWLVARRTYEPTYRYSVLCFKTA